MAKEKEIVKEAIKYDIEAHLKATGFRAGAKQMKAVMDSYKTLIKGGKDQEKALNIAMKAFARKNKSMLKVHQGQKKAIEGVKKSLISFNSSISGMAKNLAMSGTTGFAFFNVLEDINKEMITLATSTTAYGISLDDVRKFSEGASKSLNLTRKEAMSFLKTYSEGIFGISKGGSEDKIAKNIKNVTGSNIDAMNSMMSAINAVKKIAPSLDFTDLSKGNIKGIKDQIVASGLLAGLDSKIIAQNMAYLNQKPMMNAEEEKRVKTFQALKTQAENVAYGLANAFMPILVKIGEWFKNNELTMKSLFKGLRGAVENLNPWLKTLVISFGLLKFGKWAAGALTFAKSFGAIKMAAMATNPYLLASALAIGAVTIAWGKYSKAKKIAEDAKKEAAKMEANDPNRDRSRQVDEMRAMRKKWQGMKEGSKEQMKLKAKAEAIEDKYRNKRASEKEAKKKPKDENKSFVEGIALKKRLYEGTTKLIGEQTGSLDSFIKAQQFSGNISLKSTNKRVSAIKDNISSQLKLNKELQVENNKTIQANKAALKEAKTDDEKNRARVALIGNQELSNKLINEESTLQAKNLEISNKVVDIYNMRLGILGKESGIAKGMVSLMDNFAIGVGASAEMRMNAVSAVQEEIKILEKQRRVQRNILSQDANNEAAKNKLLDVESKILQKQQDQAGMLKTLRDGWVSAIGAMNTGAGRYSKIIMSAQKNTAGLVSMGAELSAFSGSYQGGYAGGTKYSATSQGGFTDKQYGVGGREGGFAYRTRMTDVGGDIFEAGLRGDISGASRGMGSINKGNMGQRRMQGMAMSDQTYARGVAGEGSINKGASGELEKVGRNIGRSLFKGIMDVIKENSPDIQRRKGGY